MGRRWGIIPTRGVYQGLAFSGALTSGSSPLARGLRGPSPPACLDLGIIPARAGFTPCPPGRHSAWSDHPRSRGVYLLCRVSTAQSSGSSPLARGLRDDRRAEAHLHRIIPARAGFTYCGRTVRGRRRDHPRSRGVYVASESVAGGAWGSSPLARGLRDDRRAEAHLHRIIPARAGFTYCGRTVRGRRRDHPRSRGVYVASESVAGGAWGSSPLARGLLEA